MRMSDPVDPPHKITFFTLDREPLLQGNLRTFVVQGLRNLTARYPGLRILDSSIHPDRVEITLDLQRLDEDIPRIVQSLKGEVKTLAQKEGFSRDSLWEWKYEDVEVPPLG